MTHRIAMLGFGVVGQGFVEILLRKKQLLQEKFLLDTKVVAVSDIRKGSIYNPNGLKLDVLLSTVVETGSLESYPDEPGLIRHFDSFETIVNTNADTIIEATYTDVKTGQPAIDHCKVAFTHGKHVIMTNKGPVALAYEELISLAEKNDVRWGFEGSVMSGTPTLMMPNVSLAGNEIIEIKGILNGTTNYILTKMESGISYEDALVEAQRLGYAEADPTSDVEGYDGLYKILILSKVVMGQSLKGEEILRKGISHLTIEDIEEARMENKRWKLIAKVKKDGEEIIASVMPEKLPLDDPLANIAGATNAITYTCDLSGPITVIGAGAGKVETGYALLIDLLNIHRAQVKKVTSLVM